MNRLHAQSQFVFPRISYCFQEADTAAILSSEEHRFDDRWKSETLATKIGELFLAIILLFTL